MKGVIVVFALLLALVLASAVPGRGAMTGERPGWRVGDFWVYRGWSTVGFGQRMNVTERLEITGTESVDASGTTYEAFRIVRTREVSLDTWTQNTTVIRWHDVSGLALIRQEFVLAYGDRVTITYRPPAHVLEFPLALGDRWIVDSARDVTGPSNVTVFDTTVGEYEVSSLADVTATLVGSGERTFRCFVVRQTAGTASFLHSYSDDVGLWVQERSVASNGTTVEEIALAEFRYSPSPASVDLGTVAVLVAVGGAVAAVVAIVLFRRGKRRSPSKAERAPR